MPAFVAALFRNGFWTILSPYHDIKVKIARNSVNIFFLVIFFFMKDYFYNSAAFVYSINFFLPLKSSVQFRSSSYRHIITTGSKRKKVPLFSSKFRDAHAMKIKQRAWTYFLSKYSIDFGFSGFIMNSLRDRWFFAKTWHKHFECKFKFTIFSFSKIDVSIAKFRRRSW